MASIIDTQTSFANQDITDINNNEQNGKNTNQEPVSVKSLMELRAKCQSDIECAKLLMAENANYSKCNVDGLRMKIHRYLETLKQKRRNRSKTLNEYLMTEVQPPECQADIILSKLENKEQKNAVEKVITKTKDVVHENRILKRNFEEIAAENKTLQREVDNLNDKLQQAVTVLAVASTSYENLLNRNETQNLKFELEQSKIKFQKQSENVLHLSAQLIEAQKKMSKYNPRNVNKKIKRRDESLENLKTKVNEIKLENSSLKLQLAEKESEQESENEKISDLKEEKHHLQKTLSKMRKQIITLKENKKEEQEKHIEETYELKQTLSEHQQQISHMQSVIELLENETVCTFYDGKYSNEVRECCMSLLTECNVSLNKLPDIVRTVLKSFSGKVPERLPSKTLLSWMMAEAKVVASKQVAEAMLQDLDVTSQVGNVLHQDATTKFHKHYEGAQVTLKDGRSMTIGLKEVAGGDGQTYVDAFTNMINDLAESLGKDEDETKARLICSIKNFMSDQCATNKVFNESIEKMRKVFIPAVSNKYDQLSEEEKSKVLEMGHFSCRLHLLANFGTEADKALASFEDSVTEGKNPFSFEKSESGTFRLARTSAKAFTQRGSDKAGVHSYFSTFLKGKGVKNEIVTFHGHRINISFHGCGAVYMHKTDIESFLDEWPDKNGLLKSVFFDIKEPVYLAGCRAMGIFDKLVTGPFWRILEQEGSVLSLNSDLHQLQITLTAWAHNGQLPLSCESVFPEERVPLKKDAIFEALFRNRNDVSFDALTVMALELLSAQLLVLLERQAKTQLPGGDYWSPSEHVQQMASNVPKTNTISERDMAVLDNLLHAKPSASILSLEAIVMCTKNKPFSWLRSLVEEDREKILNEARVMAKSVKAKFKERKEHIEKEMKTKLIEKQKKVEMKESKEKSAKINVSRDISKYGGPWNIEELDEKLELLDEKERRSALLTQIKFHKIVLKSKGEKKLFQESNNKKKYTNDQLLQNFRIILEENKITDSDTEEENSNRLKYQNLDTSKQNIEMKKRDVMKTLLSAREKRKIDQQKKALPEYLGSPENLIGKKIQHKCIENGEEIWFNATVLSIKKVNKDNMKTEYNVRYDEDIDSIWFFPLLMDLKKGDLMIV